MKLSMVPIIRAKNLKETGLDKAEEQRSLRAETFSVGIETEKLVESQLKPTCLIVCEGMRLLLEVLIIKPKDSRKEIESESDSEVEENEGPTRRISSNQAEFLMPLSLKEDKGTFSNFVKIRGAQESPNTRATKQYRTPSKSKHKYLKQLWCIATVKKASCKSNEAI